MHDYLHHHDLVISVMDSGGGGPQEAANFKVPMCKNLNNDPELYVYEGHT